jgi:hypothetical protein
LESRRAAATATNAHYGGRLVLEVAAAGIQHALLDAQERTCGLAVVDRAAHDERIAGLHFFDDAIADIIVEDTSAAPGPLAGVTRDAPSEGLIANPYPFTLDAMTFELFGYFVQCDISVSLSAGTSMNQ